MKTTTTADHGRRGTATVEFVACIPFLAGIIIVIFFFGWTSRNQQNVWISDRYQLWRDLYHDESTYDPNYHLHPDLVPPADMTMLNQLFFSGKGQNISQIPDPPDATGLTEKAPSQLLQAAAQKSQAVNDFVSNCEPNFPQGLSTSVSASFPVAMNFWNKLMSNGGNLQSWSGGGNSTGTTSDSGGLQAHDARDGLCWLRREISYTQMITTQGLKMPSLQQFYTATMSLPGTDVDVQNALFSYFNADW